MDLFSAQLLDWDETTGVYFYLCDIKLRSENSSDFAVYNASFHFFEWNRPVKEVSMSIFNEMCGLLLYSRN